MDIQLAKIQIIRRLTEIDEEWVIRSIQRLLEIEDTDMLAELDIEPMSKEELLSRAKKAEEDIKAGRVEDIETYLQSISE